MIKRTSWYAAIIFDVFKKAIEKAKNSKVVWIGSPRRIEAFFQRLSLGKCRLAHNIAVLCDEPLNFVNVPVKPALPLCIDQFWELFMQVAEISLELPLLLWSGSFFVGDTEPIQWYGGYFEYLKICFKS